MKHQYRKSLIGQQSARTVSAYIYSSCGFGESTQDLVFAGSSMIYENGSLMAENERFTLGNSMITADIDVKKIQTQRHKKRTYKKKSPDGLRQALIQKTDFNARLLRHIEAHPFVPGYSVSSGDTLENLEALKERDARCEEIMAIQTLGLATRLSHINCRSAVIGISGGLDSTLALIVAVLAFDKLGWDRKRFIG